MGIKEYRYTPRAIDRRALWVTLACAAAAVIAFLLSFLLPVYGGLVQLFSLALLVVALFVAYKFLWVSYTYMITDPGDGIPCLLVEQTMGRRSSLLCRLPLYAILRILPAGAAAPAGKAYVYTASMWGGPYRYLTGRMEGNAVLLKLEGDDAFFAALSDAVAAVKQEKDD